MNQEIKYNGMTANPSDYECNDGDLAVSLDAILEDGAIKAVRQPTKVMEIPDTFSDVYIHETSSFKHFILWNKTTGQVSWTEDGNSINALHTFSSVEIYQIASIGNTLIILSSDGMYYFLWKGGSEGYHDLGTEIPECPLSFGLQGEFIRGDQFTISFSSLSVGEEFSDENKKNITSQVLAKVNKFIADNSTNKGKFIYPFLLRYAYRLYDGTLTKHSAPILMIASSDVAPVVFWDEISGEGVYTSAKLRVCAVTHTLDYCVDKQECLSALLDWKDIVSSVDVFVSKPIYTYDQNGECQRFRQTADYEDYYCVCKHINRQALATYPLRYQKNVFSKLYANTFNPDTMKAPWATLEIPRRSTDAVKRDIQSCSQFYILESIKIEQLGKKPSNPDLSGADNSEDTRIPITVEEDYLQSLVNREVMTDDYDSHDKLTPQYSFVYNSRINIANLKKKLFKGHAVASLFNFSDGYIEKHPDENPDIEDHTQGIDIYVYIKQDGKDIVVRADAGTVGMHAPLLFFYYPNINAYKAVIQRGPYPGNYYYEVPLEKHSFLNGAFYFGGWKDVTELFTASRDEPTVSLDSERIIDVPNKIYTSEVNNPFVFPALGINTVGTGEILGISAAAKALSEGQFGQFPLYAFTTEGVWALEVSATGTYSARQPITRDVCINSDSITQTDRAVLFATDRGIMLLSGSEALCITDVINGPDVFSPSGLPKYEALILVYSDRGGLLNVEDTGILPFLEFIAGCKMVYDYVNQHILLFNFNANYGYVYSLKSKAWGMFSTKDIINIIPSYPEALVMKRITGTSRNGLYDYSIPKEGSITNLLISRPFKFGNPNILKTINCIIQRGFFQRDQVCQVLYGSNDLINWRPIWSSTDKYLRGLRGSPYKAFRLAIISTLDKSETIYGFSVEYTPRMTNQLR